MSEDTPQQIRHSTTHPKYLHSNSTSHKWVFGAIAELVDNSVDAKASQFFIDVEDNPINLHDKLFTIRDNGSGYVYISPISPITDDTQRSISSVLYIFSFYTYSKSYHIQQYLTLFICIIFLHFSILSILILN